MKRYIDADALETHEMIIPHGNGMYEDVEVVYMDDIRDMPTADVRENRKGKWIKENITLTTCPPQYIWHCSECGKVFNWFNDSILTKFCPNCGSDNRGDADA